MNLFRWAMTGVAAALGIAALWFSTRSADLVAAPAPAAAVQPLSLVLPPTALVTAGASAPSAPIERHTRPVALPAAAHVIGSEGYGPHIETALAGQDPAQAWEAVQWLRACATNEARRQSAELIRNQGIATEFMTQRMQELDAEARRCQTVTAQHQGGAAALAARAMRGGVHEAASAYAGTVFPGDLTPEQRLEVVDAMRRDALAGHAASLLGAITANEAWGLSDADRLAFLYVYAELPDEPAAKETIKALVQQGAVRLKSPPTPEQLAAAKVAGQQILARLRTTSRP